MNEQEFLELSAGHALGALSPEDERAYAMALAEHPEWWPAVDADAETLAMLGGQLPSINPPVAVRAALLNAITRTPQDPAGPRSAATPPSAGATHAPQPTEPTEAQDFAAPERPELSEQRAVPSARSLPPELAFADADDDKPDEGAKKKWSFKRSMVALVASVALLSMIAVGTSSLLQVRSIPDEVLALQQIEAAPDANSASASFSGGAATVHWSEQLGKTVLVADGLPQIDQQREFELWFVRDKTPIPAGTFTSDNGIGVAMFNEKMQPGDVIAVTIEQAGGSPTGLPTTDALLAIETA